MFFEMIAPVPARVPGVVAAAEEFLRAKVASEILGAGLSPHAPYTVRRELLDAAIEIARRHQVPLAMHLAESREELASMLRRQYPQGLTTPPPVAIAHHIIRSFVEDGCNVLR